MICLLQFQIKNIRIVDLKQSTMDKEWLNFAGFLHNCIYNREHAGCPYNQFRKMDQVEKLEKLMTIKNSEATQMRSQCNCLRSQCKQKVAFSLENLPILNKKVKETALSV
jgi:hypothetical protein